MPATTCQPHQPAPITAAHYLFSLAQPSVRPPRRTFLAVSSVTLDRASASAWAQKHGTSQVVRKATAERSLHLFSGAEMSLLLLLEFLHLPDTVEEASEFRTLLKCNGPVVQDLQLVQRPLRIF